MSATYIAPSAWLHHDILICVLPLPALPLPFTGCIACCSVIHITTQRRSNFTILHLYYYVYRFYYYNSKVCYKRIKYHVITLCSSAIDERVVMHTKRRYPAGITPTYVYLLQQQNNYLRVI